MREAAKVLVIMSHAKNKHPIEERNFWLVNRRVILL